MFTPPPNPSDQQEYPYGNLIWQYSAASGVWNLKDGTLIGGRGLQGERGNTGATGGTGAKGDTGFGVPGVGGANAGYPYAPELNSAVTPTAGKIKFTMNGSGVVTSIQIHRTDYLSGNHEQEYRLLGASTLYLHDAQANGPYNTFMGAAFLCNAPTFNSGNGTFTFSNVTQVYATPGSTSNSYVGLQFYKQGGTGNTGSYPSLTNVGLTTSNVLFGGFSLTGIFGLSGNANFLFNGTACTFGGTNTRFTVTGPTFAIGYNTNVVDGIFRTPTEFAPVQVITPGVNNVAISATGGSIQRFLISPSDRYSVSLGGNGWHSLSGATETIAIIIQSKTGWTGGFGTGILVQKDSNNQPPVLGGTTGGFDVVTLMRVNKGDGTSLNMGFPIARGMTAANTAIMSNQT